MTNNTLTPAIGTPAVVDCLSNVAGATARRFGTTDSSGNQFHCSSIIEMNGQAHKYAAVYHSSDAAGFYSINLAVSDDLLNWTFVRTLIPNASMAKLYPVSGSPWIIVVHEQWQNIVSGASARPCRISYKLFYGFDELLNGTVNATWTAPSFAASGLDGTPSVYNASMQLSDGFYVVNGQFGFHSFNGTKDINSVTTTTNLFKPTGGTATLPSNAAAYNQLFVNAGAVGSIGQRDTLQTTTARYNIQEANLTGASDFSQWRLFLYQFGDSHSYPTGVGSVTPLNITTPGGSTSIGNPSVNVVTRPDGSGSALVVSYMVFAEGAAPGEGGALVYYYNI